jgi:hypothetical protein
MELIKPVWWKRVGFWLGVLFIAQGALGMSSSYGWLGVDVLALAVGMFFAVYGWRQGVVANDEGIVARRISRKRHARWSEIERFDDQRGAVAILRDGTRLRLLDWLGDTGRVVAALEGERQRRTQSARGG